LGERAIKFGWDVLTLLIRFKIFMKRQMEKLGGRKYRI
jgi:hypothetical protein